MNTSDLKYCFLDLETTGFDHKEDSIIEVSFLVCDQLGNELDRLDEVIIPHKTPLTPTITRITGIDQKEIGQSGRGWEDVLPLVCKKLENTVIIGHNIDFDIRFLRENGVDIDPKQRIDTHELARLLLVDEESYALEVLSSKYGFVHTDAHRAMSDVVASKDLFHLLEQKIQSLPGNQLQFVHDVAKKHPWFASTLFPNPSSELVGSSASVETDEADNRPWYDASLASDGAVRVAEGILGGDKNIFTRIGGFSESIPFLKGVFSVFANEKQKSVLVSPKLDFYDGVPGVPVPSILLDPDRLQTFIDQDQLTDGQIAFVLKCLFRSNIGRKDVFGFDLFFVERDWWKDVCIASSDHPLFVQRMEALMDEPMLRISAEAFASFIDHPLLQDRIVVVDEAEIVAERWLNGATKTVSVGPYLRDEEQSIAAQFFVRNVCRDVVEPLINKQVGPYPEKVVLPSHARFSSLLASLEDWADGDFISTAQTVLDSHETGLVRWVTYYPETGNLDLSHWHRDAWKTFKQRLQDFRCVFLHRHVLHERNMFGHLFFAAKEFVSYDVPELIRMPSLTIPESLVSAKDEGHIADTAQKIIDAACDRTTNDHWVGAYFTSQETLRKTFDAALPAFESGDITLFGEKMAGGDGKLMEKLQGADQATLCFQKIMHPKMMEFPIKTLLWQKFPFPVGSPLTDTLSKWLEEQNISWWDVWVVPQLQANMTRRIAQFPQLEEILFLDTRENSRWGKAILGQLFEKR